MPDSSRRSPALPGAPGGAPAEGGAATLEVARVVAVHGLKGLLKVVPHWSGSTALHDAERVTLVLPSGERRAAAVTSCAGGGKGLLLGLEGVNTREQAEALRGARIELERDALPDADPDAPYLVDLIGAEVEAPGGPLGRVVDVLVNPSVDSVLVERADGSRVEVVLRSEYLSAIDATRIVLASDDAILD